VDVRISVHEQRESLARGGCAWTGDAGEIGRSSRVLFSWVESASGGWVMVQKLCSGAPTGERASSHQEDYRTVFQRGERTEKEQRCMEGWATERRCGRM